MLKRLMIVAVLCFVDLELPADEPVEHPRGRAGRYAGLGLGGDEQTFGVNQQVPHAAGSYTKGMTISGPYGLIYSRR